MGEKTIVRCARVLKDGVGFVNVTGEVDTSTADSFRKELFHAIADTPKTLIVRLAHVSYMDSAGLAVLLELVQAARKDNIHIVLLEPSEPAMRTLDMVELDALVQVCKSLDACANKTRLDIHDIRRHTYVEEMSGNTSKVSTMDGAAPAKPGTAKQH